MATFDARPSAFTQLATTSEWEYLVSAIGGVSGVDLSIGNAFTPSLDTPGRNAVIADGVAVIRGQLWRCDAPVSTAIPAASAQNRIDRLVLRLTRGAATSATVVVPTIITGTPSGSPVKPPLVQTPTGIYDVPISSWTATSAGALTSLVDDRQFVHDTWHDMRPLQNSFVGTIGTDLPPQYKLDIYNGVVLVMGSVQTPSSGSYNGVAFFTFPSGSPYITPIGLGWPITYSFGSQSANTTAGAPRVFADPTGILQFGGIQASMNSQVVRINGSYPLAGYNGLITS